LFLRSYALKKARLNLPAQLDGRELTIEKGGHFSLLSFALVDAGNRFVAFPSRRRANC
jgi:hypothetical protein